MKDFSREAETDLKLSKSTFPDEPRVSGGASLKLQRHRSAVGSVFSLDRLSSAWKPVPPPPALLSVLFDHQRTVKHRTHVNKSLQASRHITWEYRQHPILTRWIALRNSPFSNDSVIATPHLEASEYERPITWHVTPGIWSLYPGIGPSFAIRTSVVSVLRAINSHISNLFTAASDQSSLLTSTQTLHTMDSYKRPVLTINHTKVALLCKMKQERERNEVKSRGCAASRCNNEVEQCLLDHHPKALPCRLQCQIMHQ